MGTLGFRPSAPVFIQSNIRVVKRCTEVEGQETKSRVGLINFEKRGHPRFSVDLPIEYHQSNSSAGLTGRAINASEGGLLIYLPEKVEIGQHLRLKLFFVSGSELNTIEIMTEVVWRDMHLEKSWGDFRSGVKFVDISTEDLNKLKKFLTSLSE